ncbi:MAG: hypothetical protein IAE82_15870 [Opitutaceae bacterium]|nr:hypothetical protein [Opitutaceae bacterium]
MKSHIGTLFVVAAVAVSTLHADVIVLKNGNTINGTYRGGTATTVSFEAYGNVMQLSAADIVSIKFEDASRPPASAASVAAPAATPAVAPASAPVAPPAAPTAARSVTLPAGTLLVVRMDSTVSTKSVKPGASFSAKLEYDLVADGAIVARAGAKFQGKVQAATQAKRARGQSTLDLRLVQIVPSGSPVPIATSSYKEAGENSIKKVAKAAAVGAVIGNNTGSGDQGDGAAIGAGVAMLKPGEPVVVAAGTLVEFSLTQPVTLPALP